jgi:glycosyltransferase involved in cell wall biosynthesis
MTRTPTHALFVNSGILGLKTFARFVERAFSNRQDDVRATQILLTEGITPAERVVRRVLCSRLWHDGWGGVANLDFMRYRAEWNAGWLARKRIRELERSGERFDVLHFHRQAASYASLDRIRRTPTIISIDCTQSCVVRSARSRLEARTYEPNVRRDGEIFRAAKLIVSTSQWAADCLRAEYPDCTTEIAVMPNPVELDGFDPAWIDERYARATQSPGYKPRVLFMGGDLRRKGGEDLLDAWRAGQLWTRARLEVVTSVPVAARLLSEGVTVRTGVTAHSPEWRRLWREADVFVLPTRQEAFGLVYQEAAAAGLPSIGTRINAIPELVLDRRTGLLIEPEAVAPLTTALNCLIDSAEVRRDFGTRARERVVQTANPDTYRRHLASAIHHVANRAAGSTRSWIETH